MVQKGVTSVKLAMEKLEHFLELGGTKKDITLLVISGIALIVSIFDLAPLPFDASWAAIILCGIPIILEAAPSRNAPGKRVMFLCGVAPDRVCRAVQSPARW